MQAQIMHLLRTMLQPIRNRIYTMISRAVLEAVDDSKKMQLLKLAVLAGENRDEVEYFQDYGFTSVPKSGSEALVVCPQGNREHMIAVKVADRTVRLKGLQSGEVAIFTDEGDKIHLKRGNNIEVVAATKVLITSPDVEMTGNLLVKGNSTVEGNSETKGNHVTKGTDTTEGAKINLSTTTATGLITAISGLASAAGSVAAASIATPTTDLDSFKTTYNTHTHNENGTGGGVTNPPNQTV